MGGGNSKNGTPPSNSPKPPTPSRPRTDSDDQQQSDTPQFTKALATVRQTVGHSHFSKIECRSALEDSLGNPEMAVMLLLEANQIVNEELERQSENENENENEPTEVENEPTEVNDSSDDDNVSWLFDDEEEGDGNSEAKQTQQVNAKESTGERKDDFEMKGKDKKSKKKKPIGPPPFNKTLIEFEMTQLQESTEKFTSDNMLGTGGFGAVFRGTIQYKNYDRFDVAVKKLIGTNFNTNKTFAREVQILAEVNHPNVVRLYGWSMTSAMDIQREQEKERKRREDVELRHDKEEKEEKEKEEKRKLDRIEGKETKQSDYVRPQKTVHMDVYLPVNDRCLVYAYMVNGSLDQHLIGDTRVCRGPLSWSQRLHIALGAAEGMYSSGWSGTRMEAL